VHEIRRLYSSYPVDDPRKFNWFALDREENSAIIRGFRHLLKGSGISVRPLWVTEDGGERPRVKREDLLFQINLGVDQANLKSPSFGDEWLLPLDSEIHWAASDADCLARAASLCYWSTGLPEIGERVAPFVA
jgi:hypothetical protein